MCQRYRLIGIVLALCYACVGAWAEEFIPKLQTAEKTYYKVRVREVTPRALIVFHSKGVGQILLKDLSPQWQKHFGYSSDAAQDYAEAIAEQNEQAERDKKARMQRLKNQRAQQGGASKAATLSSDLLALMGTPVAVQKEVDLRPQFRQLELRSKNQGRRPSCSAFAVVSALEFQNAKAAGKPEKLSEEYLIWATRKTLGLKTYSDRGYDEAGDSDIGFTLLEVVQALRAYGIPSFESMPNTFGKSSAKIEEPSAVIIQEARERRKVFANLITGRTNEEQIDNILHILNAGVPVVIGTAWPHGESLVSAPILSQQKPKDGYAHAVTLVGYRSEGGKKDETLRFVFKNSWGIRWGVNGHGWITYDYLKKHMNSAVFLDVGLGSS